MGVVYKARQSSLGRTVALKMILSGQLASPGDVERFHAEAEAAANLDHPHIVPIYEVAAHEGTALFYDETHGRRQPGRAACRPAVACRIAAARAPGRGDDRHGGPRGTPRASAADLAPRSEAGQYPLRRASQPFVSDFGLAKQRRRGQPFTQSGAIVGTPAYMAPEQAAAKELTTAADVYSLGAVLYELLAGRPPLRGETPMETLCW